MSAVSSYPKVYALGHRHIQGILQDPNLIVEEKIDGSQFSFSTRLITDEFLPAPVELYCRSKGADINLVAPEKMFKKAVERAEELASHLTPGWVYRCEYLANPKHNVLAYDRTPTGNLILFDIMVGPEDYLDYENKRLEAERLGLEVVPLLYSGPISDYEFFRSLLDRTSILGGQKIEGVVVKNYSRFCTDGKPMIGKFVSEAFKEVHKSDWRERNPKGRDILAVLIDKYTTPARWNKAIQHLREAGLLEDSPKDIGLIMKAVAEDVEAEEQQEVMAALYKWAWPQVRRGLTRGLPEWYKEELLKKALTETAECATITVSPTQE